MTRKVLKALRAWLRALYGATFVRRRSLTLVSLLLIVVYSIGFSTSFWLPLRLGYLLLFGVILAGLWNWLSTRDIGVQVRRTADRLQVGETMEEFVEVRNTGRIPKLWVEVEVESDLPEHRALHVVSLHGGMHRQWRAETTCERRGHYTLGPVIVRGGDPFALFHREERHGEPHNLVVYPRPLPLPHYRVPPADSPGELDPASEIWIVLDLDAAQHAGSGDESTIEYGVTTAASVARLFLAQNRSVGLMMFGTELVEVAPNRDSQQLARLLEALAAAQPVSDVPLGTLLNEQARTWGRNTTLIAITAATDPRWVTALRALTARGAKAAVVLLHLESFGGRRGIEEMMETALTSGFQLNLVRQGDDLPDVLGPATGGRAELDPALVGGPQGRP